MEGKNKEIQLERWVEDRVREKRNVKEKDREETSKREREKKEEWSEIERM